MIRSLALSLVLLLLWAQAALAAAPNWVEADDTTTSGTTSPATFTTPTNLVSGDLIVLVWVIQNGGDGTGTGVAEGDITAPAGFATFHEGDSGSNGDQRPRAVFFTKTATGSEPASYDVTWSGNATAWRGVAGRITGWGGTLLDSGTNSTSTSVVTLEVPGLTTTVNDTLRLVACVWRGSAVVDVSEAGLTAILTESAVTPSWELSEQVVTTAGAAGDVTCDSDTSLRAVGNSLYIQPGGGAVVNRAPLRSLVNGGLIQ